MSFTKLSRFGKLRLALSATLIVLSINAIIPSAVNGFTETINLDWGRLWENEVAEIVFEARWTSSVFKRRPLVLQFQYFAFEYLGLPYQFSFNVINTFFIFSFFLLMMYWSDIISSRFQLGLNNELLCFWLMSILPISCAFFATILTYDDFLQYTFLVAAFILYFKEQTLLAACMFFASCLSRETSIILLPFFLMFSRMWRKYWLKDWITFCCATVLYFLFLAWYLDHQGVSKGINYFQHKRIYAWQSNFENLQKTREAITVGAMMVFLPLYLLLEHLGSSKEDRQLHYLIKAAVVLIIANAIVVYVFALARESRLFVIPLILATPLLLPSFKRLIKCVQSLLSQQRWKIIFFSLLFGLFLGGWFYTPTTVGTGYIFKAYAVIYFSICGIIFSRSMFDLDKQL